ncbi:hypothetical protein [Gordonia otitidis]|uniref:Uncharacterized protein n=1 Tax=Gordonia otitidis (strain DSM 44809 / CCUG 52243 / JCM 12355 / NBRC 100426 / IFM 10032) TaxID=1108044 RepID=H5TK22_GORO1|nr:hypothetical protein [Gordonia otitidis]GAB33830.1 hypothetical protein GOOTI_083_00050 [Gordonia otitidis NBRC 100426]
MSLADNVSDIEIETVVLMLDPAVQHLATCTAGICDRAIDSPEFRSALSETANHVGIADSTVEALFNAVIRLRVTMGIAAPVRRDGRASS